MMKRKMHFHTVATPSFVLTLPQTQQPDSPQQVTETSARHVPCFHALLKTNQIKASQAPDPKQSKRTFFSRNKSDVAAM